MAKKIPIHTNDEELLSQTICDIMGNQDLFKPLATTNLFMAMERLHFSTHLYFDKMQGKWCFSNLPEESWPKERRSDFSGVNFIITEFTAEMAIAKGVHYYYHLKIKD